MDLELSAKVVEDHQGIVSAIATGDRVEALGLLEQHLTKVGYRYEEFLDRLKSQGKDIENFVGGIPLIVR